MTTLKLHYDGWLALPAGMRQTLGLNSGDRIEATLVDGALVLRPSKAKKPAPAAQAETKPPAGASPAPVPPAGHATTTPHEFHHG